MKHHVIVLSAVLLAALTVSGQASKGGRKPEPSERRHGGPHTGEPPLVSEGTREPREPIEPRDEARPDVSPRPREPRDETRPDVSPRPRDGEEESFSERPHSLRGKDASSNDGQGSLAGETEHLNKRGPRVRKSIPEGKEPQPGGHGSEPVHQGPGPLGKGPGPLGEGPGPLGEASRQPGEEGGQDDRSGSFLGGSRGEEFGRCSCSDRRNPCTGVVGSQVKGCPNTNRYLQCDGATCSNQTCPSGQVWNKTQNACAACASGMHVATNLQVCVCDQGKTFRNRTCVDCPTDSIQEPDRCYCNGTKIFDKLKNACKDCPAGSTLDSWSRRCQCTNTTQIWSDADWACKDCPGEWLPKRTRRPFWSPSSRCTCTGTNQVFDRQTVTCYTCPTGTTASRDNANCLCSDRFKFFNWTTKQCDCAKGLIPDPAGGTGCVRPAVTTSTTTANPGNAGSP